MRVIMITKKNLILAVVFIVAIIAGIITLIALKSNTAEPTFLSATSNDGEYELYISTANKKELPVYSVERSDKKIALTIDAAWEDDKTDFILSELEKNNVKATFFLCGFWAKKYPDKVKAIADKGHEIGNHSATHPHMNSQSSSQIQKELKDYDDLLESITGKRSTCFRAPYGEYNDNVIKTVRAMGYEVVQWSIDTIDWKEERSCDTILETVIPNLSPGCIILCHNNGFKITEYLPKLLSAIKEQGYEPVTMSELLLSGNTIIDVNGVQRIAGRE